MAVIIHIAISKGLGDGKVGIQQFLLQFIDFIIDESGRGSTRSLCKQFFFFKEQVVFTNLNFQPHDLGNIFSCLLYRANFLIMPHFIYSY